MAAMLTGFLSILATIHGLYAKDSAPYYEWAAKLIMLTMILDGIDGNLARALKGTSEFGAELDTYVDMTAFGIAPAILIFAVTFKDQAHQPLWHILLPSAVAVSGVVRLARFKVRDPLRGQGGYAGLPITANAGWVAMFVFISQSPPPGRFSLQQGPVAALFLAGIVTFIVLQVTNFRYPKPTKKLWLFLPCVVLVILFLILPSSSPAAIPVAVIMIALGVLYIGIGPLFVKGMDAHRARKEAMAANGQNGQNGQSQNGKESGLPEYPR